MKGLYLNQSESYLHFRNPGKLIFVLGIYHFSLPTSISASSSKSTPISPWRLTLSPTLSPVLREVLILCWIAVVECLIRPLREFWSLGHRVRSGYAKLSRLGWIRDILGFCLSEWEDALISLGLNLEGCDPRVARATLWSLGMKATQRVEMLTHREELNPDDRVSAPEFSCAWFQRSTPDE